MKRSNRYRLIVQRVRDAAKSRWGYRRVVYGGAQTHTFTPVSFDSIELLLSTLRSVLPQADTVAGCNEPAGEGIVFTADLELTDSQLARLGVLGGGSKTLHDDSRARYSGGITVRE